MEERQGKPVQIAPVAITACRKELSQVVRRLHMPSFSRVIDIGSEFIDASTFL